jgi:hypothetical protein
MTLLGDALISVAYRPVVKLKQGVVIIEWTTAKHHERQQRIADSS